MAYIGRGLDKISNIEKLDVITFDGSQSYTLQKGGSNFTPSSANNLFVSIDGVVQAGNFTVSGSTIDFGTAVAGTSTNDFIFHFGTGVVFTPADGTVTAAKLASSVITGQTEDTTPADDDLILTYDTSASTLKKVQKSNFAGGGITEIDQWRLTSTISPSNSGYLDTNMERVDDAFFDKTGTGMSVSSGVWTFPSTGKWICRVIFQGESSAGDLAQMRFYVATDGSTFTNYYTETRRNTTDNNYQGATDEIILNVNNTSNIKLKVYYQTSTNAYIYGGTTRNLTYLTFIRLGDST